MLEASIECLHILSVGDGHHSECEVQAVVRTQTYAYSSAAFIWW